MSWTILVALVLGSGLAFLALVARRLELGRMERRVEARARAERAGSRAARLQHPVVDLSRCLGCATCVAVCPEEGVLDIVHGQATVVNGARCAGVSACERECPAGAITVTLTNLETRTDVPVLTEELEAPGAPGLFLAGEVTAHALIRTAVEHGTAVARAVAARCAQPALPAAAAARVAAGPGERAGGSPGGGVLDLAVVGAGPAGLACALEAKRLGLSALTLDRADEPGGTVATYPRHKLVLTRPVDLPLVGRLARTEWTKEELVDLWRDVVAREALSIRFGRTLEALERHPDGHWVLKTDGGEVAARCVCVAVGRRGAPRRLGVPGEDRPKVAYGLSDARSYQGRRILVVGGGDSAVETALGLAGQPGNEVTLSYRRDELVRVRARNVERLEVARAAGRVDVVTGSRVVSIGDDAVELEVHGRRVVRANDDVFVMAGGTPPFEMLQRAGVSFDPRERPPARAAEERGTGLLPALGAGFLLSCLALVWTLGHSDYYLLSIPERPTHPKHAWLRPGQGVGLGLGLTAVVLVTVNLVYLARRSPRVRLGWGSLRAWMTSHVATGILAFLCALVHAAMTPRDTVGGHALAALGVLVATGAVGRYFYAWVPRAANGRELELGELKGRLEDFQAGGDAFSQRVRDEVAALIRRRQWGSSFPARVLALLGVQLDLRRALRRLDAEAEARGVDDEARARSRALARRAWRSALAVAHFEDLRAVLNTWRWVHRWVALLMVLLLAAHVFFALTYGAHLFDGGAR